MSKIDYRTMSEFVDRLLQLTKNNKLHWKPAHHYEDSPAMFDTYAMDLNSTNETIVGSGLFIEYNEGFIHLMHVFPIDEIPNYDPIALRHGVYMGSVPSAFTSPNSYYLLCIQPMYNFYLEEVNTRADLQKELFTLHQLIIRNSMTINNFIADFLNDTSNGIE